MEATVIRWPGGEHPFRLGLEEYRVIQQKTDCGPEYLLWKINNAQWFAAELVEIIRNGLIGGGMGPVEALKAVHAAFDTHPHIAFKVPAQEIIAASLYGPPDDQPGEDLPVEPTPAN